MVSPSVTVPRPQGFRGLGFLGFRFRSFLTEPRNRRPAAPRAWEGSLSVQLRAPQQALEFEGKDPEGILKGSRDLVSKVISRL